ncbi:MAG: DUF4411 family protein [Candidatus Woesearchaeota archaeon]
MSDQIYILDSNFLININYYFNDRGENYEKLLEFLKTLIQEKKIIILDKVEEEFNNSYVKNNLNLTIKKSKDIVVNYDIVIRTTFLKSQFDYLAQQYYIKENEQFFQDKPEQHLLKQDLIEQAKKEFKELNADLYLILYAKYIKKETQLEPIIITDENTKNDKKLYDKIPNICRNEKIQYIKTPQFIFTFFNLERRRE